MILNTRKKNNSFCGAFQWLFDVTIWQAFYYLYNNAKTLQRAQCSNRLPEMHSDTQQSFDCVTNDRKTSKFVILHCSKLVT